MSREQAIPFSIVQDWSKFCTLDGIVQKTGVDKRDIGNMILKELIDNSLDEGTNCRIGEIPDGFFVEDEGKGIGGNDEELASLFSVSRPLITTKLFRYPTRGALGNGLRIVAGGVIATGGTLVVSTRGRTLKLMPMSDGSTKCERMEDYDKLGTRIEITLPKLSVDLKWGHAIIYMARGSDYSGKTSAYWYDSESFHELCCSLQNTPIRDFIKKFEGVSGKVGSIVREFFTDKALSSEPINSLSRDDTNKLLGIIRGHSKKVKPERLGMIDEFVGYGYFNTSGEFKQSPNRGIGSEIPFVIEAWVKHDLFFPFERFKFFVNRTHIIGGRLFFFNNKSLADISGCNMEIKANIGKCKGNYEIIVNVLTPHMPIMSDGKAPDLSYVSDHIRVAIEKASKRFRTQNPNYNADKKEDWILVDTVEYCSKKNIAIDEMAKGKTERIFGLWRIMNSLAESFNEKWGPMTIRRLYYELVSAGIIKSGENSYKYMDNHLTDGRREGIIDPDFFEDRTRKLFRTKVTSHRTNVRRHIKDTIKSALTCPELDVWETQDHHVELWIEKEAMSTFFEKLALKKHVPLFPCRGYTSFTKLKEAQERFVSKTKEGKKCVILYFGDLDPSGWDIYRSIKDNLPQDLVNIERTALNPDQVKATQLIPMPAKESDTRYKTFKNLHEEHGFKDAYELDALAPELLLNIAEEAIDRYFDNSLVPTAEIERWHSEYGSIKKIVFELLDKSDF